MKNNRQLMLIMLHLIRPAIAVVFAAVMVNFISWQIVATSKKINEKRTLYAALERRTETVTKIEEDFELVGKDAIGIMDRAFPPADNILEFIVAMESLASRSSVTQSLTFGTPAPFAQKGEGTSAVSISSIDLNLNLTGNAANMVRYLIAMEKFPYLSSLSSLQITSSAGAGWESMGNMVGRGKLYTKTAE